VCFAVLSATSFEKVYQRFFKWTLLQSTTLYFQVWQLSAPKKTAAIVAESKFVFPYWALKVTEGSSLQLKYICFSILFSLYTLPFEKCKAPCPLLFVYRGTGDFTHCMTPRARRRIGKAQRAKELKERLDVLRAEAEIE
jgi:hypothetical protein